MMKTYLLFLLLPLFLLRCGKNGNSGPTIIEGTVLNNATHQPVPYAEVWVTAQARGTLLSAGLGGGIGTAANYQKTGANGHFYFSFNADYVYDLWLSAKNYAEGLPDQWHPFTDFRRRKK